MPENPKTLQQKKDYLKSITIDKNSILNGINSQSEKNSKRSADPFRQAQVTSFNAGPTGLQFDRYYSHPAYSRLGFNPYIDNESNYNANSTKFEDFKRSSSQWGKLFGIGFSSTFTGTSDVQQALDYENASRIGSTSRGGAFGTINNAYLNSGYTIGLISEIAAEEVALGALTAFSGGAGGTVAAARTAQNVARLGKTFTNVNRFSKGLFRTADRLNDLKDIGKAKTFYEGLKKGLGVVNPLKGTSDFITASKAGQLDNISSMAKLTKGFGSFYRDIREINLALGESNLEAGFVNNTVSRDLYNEYLQKHGKAPEGDDLDRIQELASKASQSAYIMNAGLIYTTNRLAFDGFFRKFKPRFGSETLVKNNLGKVVANKGFMKSGQDAFEFVKKGIIPEFKNTFSKASLKQSPLKVTKFLAKYTKTNFSEGTQEWFQEVIQDAEVQRSKDDYYQALKGGYYDYYSRSMSKFVDSNGLEVFMSGFVMGGMIAPVTYLQGSGAQKLTALGTRVFQPGKYKEQQEYKKTREENLKKQLDILNEISKNPTKYFNMSSLGFLTEQVDLTNQSEQHAQEGKEKEFRDKEDQAVGQSLLYALKSGMFDNFIDQLESMSQMEESELREAFSDTPEQGVESLTSFKENSSKIVERAKTLKTFYDKVNNRFQNPFQVQDTSVGDEDGNKLQQIKYAAYEKVKDSIILNQYNFSRTLDRMKSITQDLTTNTPFWKESSINASDITLLLSTNDLNREITLLREEVSNMVGSNSIDRDEIKKKENRLKYLEKFKDSQEAYKFILSEKTNIDEAITAKRKSGISIGSEVLVNTQKGGKAVIVAEITLKGGKPAWLLSDGRRVLKDKVDIEGKTFKSEALDPVLGKLKNNFDSYMKYLAGSTNNYTDAEKLESAFQKLVDFYSLDQDSTNMSEAINSLMDPKGFSAYHDREYQILKYQWDNRRKDLEESLKAFQKAAEENELVQQIAKTHGAFIVEEDLEKLIDDNIIPDEFYDINTLNLIPTDSDRHTKIIDEIREFLSKTGRIPEESEETSGEVVEEPQEVSQTLSIQTLHSMVDDEGRDTWPTELKEPIINLYMGYMKSVSSKGITPLDMKSWLISESAIGPITSILDKYNSTKNEKLPKEDELVEAGEDYIDPGEIPPDLGPEEKTTINLELDEFTSSYITDSNKFTIIRTNNFANSIGLGKFLESAHFYLKNKEGKKERYTISNTGFLTVDEAQGKAFMVKLEGLPTEPNSIYKYPVQVDDITYYSSEEATAKWLSGSGKMVVLGIVYDPEIIPSVEDDLKIINNFDKKFIPRIKEATTVDDILEIEKDLMVESSKLIREHNITLDNYIPDMLNEKLNQINTDLSIDNIALHEILVLKGKMSNFGTVKVNAKGQNKKGLKYIRVKSITNPELDETAIYESQTKNMISQKGINAIAQNMLSQKDESILDETNKNQTIILDNKEQIKKVIEEAKSQSIDDIDNEFLDSLGCK